MELKCTACGSNKLLKYKKFFDVQVTDSQFNLNEDCYVCESCRHIEFYATEQGLNKAKIEAQLEKERELIQLKKNEERDKLLQVIQRIEAELNEIADEIESLTKQSNDDNITVKRQTELLKLIQEKNDLYIKTNRILADKNRELKKYYIGHHYRHQR
ncbi:MAG: hypothetical protein RBT45_03395 [Acholeplasmataceae bacterium]|jgi:DNA repair exonuclease SbcCD ATPase subunit|nr:hypothetical protein [Acholeplasmataceae bacterium]